MAILSDPWTGNTDAPTDPIVGADIASWYDAIRTVVNALDNTNIAAGAGINITKLDLGVVSHHLGAATNLKEICGVKTVTLAAGTITGTVDFNTDADTYGSGAASDFTATPVVTFGIIEGASTTDVYGVRIVTGTLTTAGFTFRVRSTAAGDVSVVIIHWRAIGAG